MYTEKGELGDRQWLKLIKYTEVEMHRLLRNRVCAHIQCHEHSLVRLLDQRVQERGWGTLGGVKSGHSVTALMNTPVLPTEVGAVPFP